MMLKTSNTYPWSFFKKITFAQTLIIFLTLSSTAFIGRHYFKKNFVRQIEDQLRSSLVSMESAFLTLNVEPQKWCGLVKKNKGERLTMINASGVVICDTELEVSYMDNHGERPEIKEAKKKGFGKSIRHSSSLDKDLFYGSISFEFNGRKYYAREALPIRILNDAVDEIEKSFFLILLPLFLLMSIISIWLGVLKESHEGQRLIQIKEELISNISHEVRTPLTAIKGYIQMINAQEDSVGPEFREYLIKIENNSSRLAQLFGDILDLSTLEGKKEFLPEIIDLEEFTLRAINNVKHSYPNKKIEVHHDIALEMVYANHKILHQIVNNLIDNAYKYTPDGGEVWINWGLNENLVYFKVKDTGIGISPKHLDRIFERFYRVDVSRSREMGGTGLGLAIVKHSLAYLKGTIEVQSEVDKGTTFTVRFPYEKIPS